MIGRNNCKWYLVERSKTIQVISPLILCTTKHFTIIGVQALVYLRIKSMRRVKIPTEQSILDVLTNQRGEGHLVSRTPGEEFRELLDSRKYEWSRNNFLGSTFKIIEEIEWGDPDATLDAILRQGIYVTEEIEHVQILPKGGEVKVWDKDKYVNLL